MTYTPPTLTEAWDALVAQVAAAGLTIETPALIESGAAGRRHNGDDCPRGYVVVPGAPLSAGVAS